LRRPEGDRDREPATGARARVDLGVMGLGDGAHDRETEPMLA
jgi:hypothetical protein